MRGKRSKQYRKLMQQYALTFGFREPYQVVVDAQMLQDAHRFTMDLPAMLSRTLHGDVKPMITQCSIRHLYALPVEHHGAPTSSTPSSASPKKTASSATQPLAEPVSSATKTALLSLSRSLTLRRCGHHTLPEPLSPLECLSSVLDPGASGTNKHRLVLAAQDTGVRRWARAEVRGVPSIYVKRSVMVMEPMTQASERVKQGLERGKLKGESKSTPAQKKRRRDDADADEVDEGDEEGNAVKKPKLKAKGPKQPNPLSMRKKKMPRTADGAAHTTVNRITDSSDAKPSGDNANQSEHGDGKRKRRRKHGKTSDVSIDTKSSEAVEATL